MNEILNVRNINVGFDSYLSLGFLFGPYKFDNTRKINVSILLLLLLYRLTSLNKEDFPYVFFCVTNKVMNFVLKQSMQFYQKSFKFYYINLKFMGLGFRLRKLSKSLLKLFLVRSNFIYLFVPKTVLVVLPRQGNFAKVKRLLFFGFSPFILNCLVSDVLLLKKLSPYRVYGILNPKRLVILRSGKQR